MPPAHPRIDSATRRAAGPGPAAIRHGDGDWNAFAKTLRRLIRDGIRLRKRSDFTPQNYQSRILRIGRRLAPLPDTISADQ